MNGAIAYFYQHGVGAIADAHTKYRWLFQGS